jgi:hypothetical protein
VDVALADFSPVDLTNLFQLMVTGNGDVWFDNIYFWKTPISAATVWTGSLDNDWHNAGNWDNGIPGAATDVTIPTGLTNYPTILTAAECNNLFIASGASLLDNGLLTMSGTATVERDYTGNQWHLVGSPVVGETANTFFGLYLQTHDEVSNTYSDVIDETTPLVSGQGFAVWNQNGDATASFSGTLTSSVSRSLTRTTTGDNSGWNLVSNPFPSSIDWLAASGWTKTNVAGTIYLYTGSTWATYSVPGSGTNGGTQYIASSQGFFVNVNDDGSSTGTLGMDNDVRVHDATAFFKDELSNVLKLQIAGNGYTDETAIIFSEGATTGFDSQFDAHKLFSMDESVPQVYSTANGFMAVNVLPDITSVAIDVKATDGEIVSISAIEKSNFEQIYLEDLYTGEVTDLTNEDYVFTSFAGIQDRFMIHFATLAVDDNLESNINIYSHLNEVYVATPENTSGSVVIYDMMGQEVMSSALNGALNSFKLEKSAYYLVRVISNTSTTTKKVFIK